jgi:hypothetical protein
MYPVKALDELDAEELIDWATDDTSAEKSNEDYFEHAHFASKIAARLRPHAKSINEKYNFTYPSCGIRGGFGSGKSSVINMTERILEKVNPGMFVFCKVSCWGFEDSLTAQEKMLEQIIDTMDKNGIDTDPLIGVPRQYILAISKVNNYLDAFFEMFRNDAHNAETRCAEGKCCVEKFAR